MRRFPPPWTVETPDGGFKIVDANGQRGFCTFEAADHLELLVRVLEAHKVLFAKADQPKANG